MASDLKWRMGFGRGPILVLLCAGIAATLFTGMAQWLAIGVAVLALVYVGYQYRRWNARGWRRVHFRAMLAYSEIARREDAIARRSGREFDLQRACSELGLLLCGEDRKAVVDTMLAELRRYEGAFLVGLVERHAGNVLPGAGVDLRRAIDARLRTVRFGPELVIASVIENIYGGSEAARYAIAVAAGDTA
jgi:hypothetical protein